MIRNVASAAILVLAALLACVPAQAQVSLTAPGVPAVVDFNGFTGAGFIHPSGW